VLVEACVDTPESALAAQAGGAGRVELCANLVEGGTTPSAGMIAVTRERLSVPLFVIVRPRGGDFLYSSDEVDVMRRDIAVAASLGAAGVVLGALTADGEVDMATTRQLLEDARPMQVTFHRAFDATRDPMEALGALLALGVDRVLTSGGAPSALAGVRTIARLVERAGDRLVVLAGGGITEENAGEVVRETGVSEIHVRGTARVESAMRHRRTDVVFGKPYVPDEFGRLATSAERIRRVVTACRVVET
jgi:copper homeostasis protein